ncbi:MAG: LytTR family transcriptional regulator [Bacteroidales bacterium]|nr:LytTR family transcriptional regulator [Bacteroidales bacterium]
MSQISKIFRRFIPQLLHMIVLPVFFFAFMLIYRPANSVEFLGGEWFGVHLTICSCVVFLSAVLMRLLYYYLPMKMNYSLYILWCVSEIIFTAFFVALYIWLVRHKPMPYFEAFTVSFKYLFLTLLIPYVILALSLRLYEFHTRTEDHNPATLQRMRFYDDRHNLKIVLTPEDVLYITAEENYVNIFYTENGKLRTYVLRSSMKALEELCQDNGLVRCHRSFYVNPSHVKVLRKDKEGIVYAELDDKNVMHIPVTKRYYDSLAEML